MTLMEPTLLDLFRADYAAFCRPKGESRRRRRLAFLPRLITNPSLQAVLILRLANRGPAALGWFWRHVLMAKHAMDFTGRYEIGPGLTLPHPVGILIGPKVRIGTDVEIAHNVSIGGDAHGRAPVIGDRVHIYPGAVIIGNLTIGEGSVVGALSFVTKDVPPNSVVKRGVVEPMRESSFSRAVGSSSS
ncbi:MAG: serine acetyltransferase [Solirubrobacteraceae bacterium]|nr:serine acetyltransferase [Solirubrobacteraceae bacterium]